MPTTEHWHADGEEWRFASSSLLSGCSPKPHYIVRRWVVQDRAYFFRQLVVEERLLNDECLTDASQRRLLRKACDEEQRQPGSFKLDLTTEFGSVHPGHGVVEQDQIEIDTALDNLQGCSAASCLNYDVSHLF
jgi:hypothetical protein